MLTMNVKLAQMKGPEGKSEVWLFSSRYGSKWNCNYEATNDGISVKIEESGDSPEAALDAAYAKWLRITGKLPEFQSALPPPEPKEEHHDGDKFIVPPATDDDIPF